MIIHIVYNDFLPFSDMCKSRNLHQSAYFLGRDLSFRQDREQRLRQELKPATKEPVKIFRFKTKIWFPKNWIVQVSDPSGSLRPEDNQKIHTSVSVLDAAIPSGKVDNHSKVIVRIYLKRITTYLIFYYLLRLQLIHF